MKREKHKIYLTTADRALLKEIIGFYIRFNQPKVVITLRDGSQEFEPKIGSVLKHLGIYFEVF